MTTPSIVKNALSLFARSASIETFKSSLRSIPLYVSHKRRVLLQIGPTFSFATGKYPAATFDVPYKKRLR
jgi:hypothetical protein